MKPIQGRSLHLVFVRLAVLGLYLIAAPAVAQTQTGFEPPDYQGSPDGIVITGQQDWYLPDVPGSTDQYVFTYDSNSLGLPTNTSGELQFLGAQVASSDLARAQHDFPWGAADVWTASYDFAVSFNGIAPASNNIGSVSLQDSTVARYFIALNVWVPDFEGTQWIAGYFVFDASGGGPNGVVAGPEWQNLAVNHWYNQSTTFDFVSNQITSVSITDLETGNTATFAPSDWYLAGGAGGGGLPLPTAVRFFVGGNDPGNIQGFDNAIANPGGARAPNGEQASGPLSLPLTPETVTQ